MYSEQDAVVAVVAATAAESVVDAVEQDDGAIDVGVVVGVTAAAENDDAVVVVVGRRALRPTHPKADGPVPVCQERHAVLKHPKDGSERKLGQAKALERRPQWSRQRQSRHKMRKKRLEDNR
ncbi:unnamed protein product [Protopolystoma xenopodis]|uniref:Uncharacterized protein n=1 Tax=Protopolystoma xenopodis TaxID=117903 RepID=A0A448XLN5_9PLAT|nr:unnamed protein product [Protopolystoma xenopodis]